MTDMGPVGMAIHLTNETKCPMINIIPIKYYIISLGPRSKNNIWIPQLISALSSACLLTKGIIIINLKLACNYYTQS